MDNYPSKIYSKKIPGSEIIDETSVAMLEEYKDAVLLFMGAGDIQKIEDAYVKYLQSK